MPDNSKVSETQEKPILNIIQQIKDGQLDPLNIDKEVKMHCVEFLRGEGQNVFQIAQILKLSERQVKRYIKEIKEQHSLNPDPEFASQFIGDLFVKAGTSYSYLLRLARTKEGTVSEKAQAELAAWHILHELAQFLQSAGYLPLQPQAVAGEFLHHFDVNNSQEISQSLVKEIIDIEKTAQETIGLPQPIQELLQKTKESLEEQPQKKEGDNDTQNL